MLIQGAYFISPASMLRSWAGHSMLTVHIVQVGQFRDLKAPSSMHLGEQLKELRKENAQLVERAMRADALQKELAEAEKQVMPLRWPSSSFLRCKNGKAGSLPLPAGIV